jgi:hypothetical protein
MAKKNQTMGFIFRCNVYVLKTYIDLETAVLDKTQLDPLTYRDAMSRLAGHVHIVTAAHKGVRRGVTITAACSVSDDPATLLVCLNGDRAVPGAQDEAAAVPGRRGRRRQDRDRQGAVGALGRKLIRLQCYEGLDVSSAVYEWNYPAR